MKKLGMGMMRLPLSDPKDPKSVDLEQVCRMVDTFLERGFTYFDTAYMYHSFQSEHVVRETLVKRHPRESWVLASKLPTMYLKEEGDQERIFAEQLEKCGVDYFDYYLVHSLDADHYRTAQKFDSFGYVARLKKAGKVRHFGFSFHDTAEVLDGILNDHPEVDFVQIQLNYLDWEDESIQSRKCYEVCVKHNKPVIVMEPVKGGTLAKVSDRVRDLLTSAQPDWSVPSWAIRFAASFPQVFMVLSGMSNMEQLLDNMSYMEDFKPLTEAEQALLPKAVKMIFEDIAVACTGCRYCVDGCPKKIEIPGYFELYNKAQNAEGTVLQDLRAEYAKLTETYGKASDCVSCRQCVRVCPQHIRIIAALKQVAQVLE